MKRQVNRIAVQHLLLFWQYRERGEVLLEPKCSKKHLQLQNNDDNTDNNTPKTTTTTGERQVLTAMCQCFTG
eukprot:937794-Amphidinium_carterae.1